MKYLKNVANKCHENNAEHNKNDILILKIFLLKIVL